MKAAASKVQEEATQSSMSRAYSAAGLKAKESCDSLHTELFA